MYNWQFIHSLDFWSIVLARACDSELELANGAPSELKPLIYPLVQVSLGAIKYVVAVFYDSLVSRYLIFPKFQTHFEQPFLSVPPSCHTLVAPSDPAHPSLHPDCPLYPSYPHIDPFFVFSPEILNIEIP